MHASRHPGRRSSHTTSPAAIAPRSLVLSLALAHALALGLTLVLSLGSSIAMPGRASAEASGGEPVDLTGTWYVLIHYQDPKTANPDAMRWKDLVWVFAKKGTRLEWTEYPIVAFEDTTGRFERIGGNPRSRVLAAWEPNPEQRKTIDDGPHVNPRGMRVKTMTGSSERGWTSPRRRSTTSAMVMSYQENLTIEALDGLPRFVREDVVGNMATTGSGGGTRYEVESIERGGRRLVGRYERDGRQRGTFRMWRTEPARGLPSKKDAEDSTPSPPGTFEGGVVEAPEAYDD